MLVRSHARKQHRGTTELNTSDWRSATQIPYSGSAIALSTESVLEPGLMKHELRRG